MTRDEFRVHARLIAFQQTVGRLGHFDSTDVDFEISRDLADYYTDLCYASYPADSPSAGLQPDERGAQVPTYPPTPSECPARLSVIPMTIMGKDI